MYSFFEFQIGEKLGAMIIRRRGLDGSPADIMGSRQSVAALVNIGCGLQTVERSDGILEQSRGRYAQGKFPSTCCAVFKRLPLKRAEPVHRGKSVKGSRDTAVTTLSIGFQKGSYAVALKIIITLAGGTQEEFDAGILPHLAQIFRGKGSAEGLLHLIVDEKFCASMGQGKLHKRFVGIFVRPIDAFERMVLKASACKKSRDG